MDVYFVHLFRSNMLQFALGMQKVCRVRLGSKGTLVGLLHVVVVTILNGKTDCCVLAVKLELSGLHVVTGRSVTDQVVFPAVGAVDNVPVKTPDVGAASTRLSSGLGLLEDAHNTLSGKRKWRTGE